IYKPLYPQLSHPPRTQSLCGNMMTTANPAPKIDEQNEVDSSGEDSDYIPEPVQDDEEDKMEEEPQESMGGGLSLHRQAYIDALWVEMNAEAALAVRWPPVRRFDNK
ncbi:unnamed protein product, partial [Discosporangium mesarthrocarpum]